jgi:hypothetical protein
MNIKSNVPLKCARCKGMKYIGQPYHAFSVWYVDVTCLICAHSKDIEVSELKTLLKKLEQYVVKKDVRKNDNR